MKDNTKLSLIKTFSIDDFSFDVGSDWHISSANIEKVITNIISNKKSNLLFCVGDLVDSDDGQDVSGLVIEILNRLSLFYRSVIFMPGNHCLRGRKDPWNSFLKPNTRNNVFTNCNETDPYVFNLNDLDKIFPNKLVMLANIFYDMEFIDPTIIGFTERDVKKFYCAENKDYKYLVGGTIELFKNMSTTVRKDLNDKIDILVTHALPHPSLVTFRVPEIANDILAAQNKLNIPFICNIADDEIQAKRNGAPNAESYRNYWNMKSFVMGSDVLSNSSFKDGLVCIHGHNHRSTDHTTEINNKQVRFISHQTHWKE